MRPAYTHGLPSASSAQNVSVLLPCGDGARVLSWPSGRPEPLSSHWPLSGEDAAAAVALSPDGTVAAVAGRAGLLDLVELSGESPVLRKRLRPFERSIAALAEFDASGGLVALGTRDGNIRVYDADTADCTHVFKAPTALTVIAFHPEVDMMRLFAGAEDGSVLAFDLRTRRRAPVASQRHHVGAVTGLCFVQDGRAVVSASRDQTVCLARVKDLKRVKLVAAKEALAAATAAPGETGSRVCTVGENGVLRTWDMESGTERVELALEAPLVRKRPEGDGDGDEEEEEDVDEVAVVGMRVCEEQDDGQYKTLISLSDQTLLITQVRLDAKPSVVDVVCGNLEEVYDIAPIPASKAPESANSSELVVASNSQSLWVMRPPSESAPKTETWQCMAALQGHTGIVLSIDSITSTKALGGSSSAVSAYVASASRDSTARIWRRSRASGGWKCIACARGHAEAVGGIALSPRTEKGQFFAVTAAADRTLKLWSLDRAVQEADKADDGGAQASADGFVLSEDAAIDLSAKWTVLAHMKDINAVAVSPDGQLIASGSQDKTLKLWSSQNGKLKMTCSGHRRGIWDVCFSTVDKIVATSSGDATVKLWGVQSGACLRSLEGHLAGVLKTVFITRGSQLASSGADGLVKVWQTRSGECNMTVDAHEDRVWALTAVGDGNRLLSGSADGTVSAWEDRTVQKQEEKAAEREQQALMTQRVNSAVYGKQWAVAARGALELGMPQKLRVVIENLVTSAEDADAELTAMVRGLATEAEESADDANEGDTVDAPENEKKHNKLITQLCLYCRDWKATGGPRSAAVAVRTLQAIFRVWTPAELSELLSTDKRALVEALVAHSGRHYQRISQLSTKVLFMEHVLESMKALPELEKASKRRRSTAVAHVENGGVVKRRKKGHDGIATEY